MPPGFLNSAGIDDALQFLRAYNKNAIVEANKAKDIEEDVILALTGLRSDLQQKIKEIKNLSGDFKNSVEKEMDNTRKAVKALQDVLGKNEADDASTTGKQDPFLLRLAVLLACSADWLRHYVVGYAWGLTGPQVTAKADKTEDNRGLFGVSARD